MKEMATNLNGQVRSYWEKEPCGTSETITGDSHKGTIEWFERIEQYRYDLEPFIHSIAQFTRHHGKKILEIGVGAGTDHLQWARAGADCYGVDLTDAAIDATRTHLSVYGFESNLRRTDAEVLPFPDASFDLVYSWGVIHHSEKPDNIIREIKRVLRPGGSFVGMMYHRYSLNTLKMWVRHALLRGKPWLSFTNVLWNNKESIGTKAYSIAELRDLFRGFRDVRIKPVLTLNDTRRLPLSQLFPDQWGWFLTINATK